MSLSYCRLYLIGPRGIWVWDPWFKHLKNDVSQLTTSQRHSVTTSQRHKTTDDSTFEGLLLIDD